MIFSMSSKLNFSDPFLHFLSKFLLTIWFIMMAFVDLIANIWAQKFIYCSPFLDLLLGFYHKILFNRMIFMISLQLYELKIWFIFTFSWCFQGFCPLSDIQRHISMSSLHLFYLKIWFMRIIFLNSLRSSTCVFLWKIEKSKQLKNREIKSSVLFAVFAVKNRFKLIWKKVFIHLNRLVCSMFF